MKLVKDHLKKTPTDLNTTYLGSTPLPITLLIKDEETRNAVFKLLLQQEGIDVNTASKKDESLLQKAVKKKFISVVKLLLDKKIANNLKKPLDLNHEDPLYNKHAIRIAAQKGHVDIFNLLIKEDPIIEWLIKKEESMFGDPYYSIDDVIKATTDTTIKETLEKLKKEKIEKK